MSLETRTELTRSGRFIILVGSIMLVLGIAIENYLFIIPGLFLLLVITSILVNFFLFQSFPEASILVSKDHVRSRGLVAVVGSIQNKNKKKLTCRITLNYSYHFLMVEKPESYLIQVEPNSETKLDWYLLAVRRGNGTIGPISISFGFFQQLFINQVIYPEKIQIKILPQRPKVQIPWKTKKDLLMQLVNQFAQRVKGQGTEFFALRDYLPGDEMKHIDWRATARHDKLITREFEDEKQLHFLIFLDLGSTMFGPKFDYALSSVVSLCSLIKGTNHNLTVVAYSHVVEKFIVPQIGIHELKLMLNLYDLDATGVQSDFVEAAKFARTQNFHHSIAIIFSDLDGDINQKLRGLDVLKLMGSKIIFVNFSTPNFNILASKEWLIEKSPTISYSTILDKVFSSLTMDEYKIRELKVRRILNAFDGDFVSIYGYDDDVVLALYRLMKKYNPKRKLDVFYNRGET
ncbi:MAG: DUF58 domain-containing protein [Candidatus Heimdallarchaeaceae archaeon]